MAINADANDANQGREDGCAPSLNGGADGCGGQKTQGRSPEGRELPQKLLLLRPSTLKALAETVGLPYKQFQATADTVVRQAASRWPAAIDASTLTPAQKKKMKDQLEKQPAVKAARRRGIQ